MSIAPNTTSNHRPLPASNVRRPKPLGPPRSGSAVALLLGLFLLSGCLWSGSDTIDDSAGSGNENLTSDGDSGGEAGTDADESSGGSTAIVDIDPFFDEGECQPELPLELGPRCGVVEVPMDWATGDGSVRLAVAVFPSSAAEPTPDPVVYLEGGPGGHALETLTFSTDSLLDPLLARGDVVVFDQRGSGLSEPGLTCPEVSEATRQLEDIPIIEDAESKRRFHEALGSCHDRLVADGIDLTDFNTLNNAHDVEAVRRALGYEQWNLFGVSYGTKLALEVLRQHPEGVRATVLDSVYPPEVDSVAENPQTFIDSYEKVGRACRSEPACANQGDLLERFRELVQDLQVNPERVTVTDYVAGTSDEVYLTGDLLVGIVTQALYSPTWFTDLPELATDLEAGRSNVARQFLSQQRTLERYFSDGMFYAISCHEEISFADPAAVVDPPDPFGLRDRFDLASNTGTNAFQACAVFENGMARAEANEPVASDRPTLLLAGSFDPVTPVSWAERAAENLSNSHLVVAEHASHGVYSTDCGMVVVAAFYDDPSSRPDGSCFAREDLQFVGPNPEEIELAEASYVVDPWGIEISTVRPEAWSVGGLGGDQYRQQSFLDPTQLFQLAGDPSLGPNLAQFIQQQWNVTLTEPAPFTGASTAGSLRPSELGADWDRRIGTGTGVAVEWFEADAGGQSDVRLYVILVSTPAEQLALVDQVLTPALKAIAIAS